MPPYALRLAPSLPPYLKNPGAAHAVVQQLGMPDRLSKAYLIESLLLHGIELVVGLELHCRFNVWLASDYARVFILFLRVAVFLQLIDELSDCMCHLWVGEVVEGWRVFQFAKVIL